MKKSLIKSRLTEDNRCNFKKYIKPYLLSCGHLQTTFAEKAGYSMNYVSLMVSGLRPVSKEFLQKLADLDDGFDMTYWSIYFGHLPDFIKEAVLKNPTEAIETLNSLKRLHKAKV